MLRSFRQCSPQLASSAWVDESAVVIGDVALAEDASVWPLVVARGDVQQIRIGSRSNVQDGSILHVSSPSQANPEGFPLHIGEDVTVGHACVLHGCSIGDRVLLGMGSTVLDGALIEDDVIVGARSLVPPGKRLQSGYLYMGVPAEPKRALRDNEYQQLRSSAMHYVRLKDDYHGLD